MLKRNKPLAVILPINPSKVHIRKMQNFLQLFRRGGRRVLDSTKQGQITSVSINQNQETKKEIQEKEQNISEDTKKQETGQNNVTKTNCYKSPPHILSARNDMSTIKRTNTREYATYTLKNNKDNPFRGETTTKGIPHMVEFSDDFINSTDPNSTQSLAVLSTKPNSINQDQAITSSFVLGQTLTNGKKGNQMVHNKNGVLVERKQLEENFTYHSTNPEHKKNFDAMHRGEILPAHIKEKPILTVPNKTSEEKPNEKQANKNEDN